MAKFGFPFEQVRAVRARTHSTRDFCAIFIALFNATFVGVLVVVLKRKCKQAEVSNMWQDLSEN